MLRVLLLLLAFLPCSAWAYGPIGHQIVGAIADEKLAGTEAGKKVALLLDGFTLEKAAVIPDEIKGWDKKGPDDPQIFHYSSRPRIDAMLVEYWKANPPTKDTKSPVPSHHWYHYTDVPLIKPQKYADGQAGRSPWDIVHASRYAIAVLQGKEPEENPRKVTKPIAIILLAHFLGDIHQPLHVGAQFFDAAGQPADPETDPHALEDQGGNTITLKHSPTAAARLEHVDSKLHGFWDSGTVNLLLPDAPKAMPKEERRATTDAGKKALIDQMAKTEPKGWKLPANLALVDYPEAWANEILPVAHEAHTRLKFSGLRRGDDPEQPVIIGQAEGTSAADKLSYEDWAAKVVRQELHLAGWRLADLLEQALK